MFQLFYGHVDEISAEGEKEENNNNRIGTHMSIKQGGGAFRYPVGRLTG